MSGYLGAAMFVAATLLLMFWLMRGRILKEKFTLWWVLLAIGVTVFAVFPALLPWFSGILGIETPSNFVFGRARIDGRPVVVGGDDFTVRSLSGTSSAEVQLDRSAGLWSFAAVVLEERNLWQFEADDGRACRIVTIVVWGRKNEPPVLQ